MNKFEKFIYTSLAILVGLLIYTVSGIPNTAENHTSVKASSSKTGQSSFWAAEHSPVIGNTNARVTLVEFIDPACEACRAMYPYIKQILSEYPNDVKLVIRYVDFHKESEQAIRILEAARQQGYFNEVLEVLMAYQPAWAPHGKQGIDPWTLFEGSKLAIEKAKTDAQSTEISQIIQLDKQDFKASGSQKTPSFFVNGKPLTLMHPDPLLEMIKKELAPSQTQ
ncbi:DsbA family protein [Thiomicrorhabdus indica]|uniref:DsbA family protein n=1 Tax=Thiomicrorhabdus indica TaxID=2267253 RepID=UPI00102E0D30|nr:thioredoxin domain-containing protein [Thiomicrorhabdus indica]